MKIGIDIRIVGKNRTGDESVFVNMIKNLAKLDNNNQYFLYTDLHESEDLLHVGKILDVNFRENFKIVSVPTGNKFAWNFYAIAAYLRKNPIDVYLTQYITPWFVSNSIKIITIVHDISFCVYPQYIGKKDLFFLRTLIPLSLKRADLVVGVSQFTCDEIKRIYGTSEEKLRLIYNALSDEQVVEASAEYCSEVRKKFNLPEKYILSVGTMQPRKNIAMLVEAFARNAMKLHDYHLVLCGSRTGHNYDKKIDEMIAKYELHDRVHFPGYISEQEKKAIYQMATIYAFPSLYEGFGIPLLEAMQSNVPVLASDIPSLKEIAAQGALYFNTNNLDNFEEKLYSICMDNSLRAKLIQYGKERVSFFSWAKSAQKMLALFNELTAK